MKEPGLRMARVVSVIAATLISLACGTNYIYSAWAPQFAEKLKLSATQSNLIGTFGNLGMYAAGIPVGLMVDARGPRLGVLLGAVLLALGYYPLHRAYVDGEGSFGMPLLCLFSLFTGIGGCSAFSAALKTSALNWPEHRGTATAFPLAAFGLSAFIFSQISSFAFPDDTGKFLLMLAIGTFSLVFVPFFFLRVVPHSSGYSALPTHEPPHYHPSDSNLLHRTKSTESSSRHRRMSDSRGRQSESKDSEVVEDPRISPRVKAVGDSVESEISSRSVGVSDETSSLLSKSSSSGPGDIPIEENRHISDDRHDKKHLDVRGWALLPTPEFWLLFILLGLLTGIGLMTINNIGNDAKALWRHWDDSASSGFIHGRQLMHVSTISLLSFCGRLLSGVGSDVLIKKFWMSRYWCVLTSACVFLAAQICGSRIENPNFLILVSSLTGLAYGTLFGVFPSLVAHTFGVHGLSQNWGTMTLAPVIAGNIFNLIYGAIFDKHSTVLETGERVCEEGLTCYSAAYGVTAIATLIGILLSGYGIYHEGKYGGEVSERNKHREHEG